MTAVKICGLTSLEDATVAVEAGADLLGFVFYPPSSRYVTPAVVRPIVAELRRRRPPVRCVGVFVDESLEQMAAVAAVAGLDTVQLHGDVPSGLIAALQRRGLQVIHGLCVRDRKSLAALAGSPADIYLLDAYVPGRMGGTGQPFDWSLAAGLHLDRPLVLAGGLTPENVARAIETVHPWGVDVSSGVEATPGVKDHDALRRFVAAVVGHDTRTES